MIFKRKAYSKMLSWKRDFSGKRALLIEGARRVGKTTLAIDFAKREYKSYLLLDFSQIGSDVKRLFEDLSNLDLFFIKLKAIFPDTLIEGQSVIIFDEVQLFPLARQAIKHLVADGRFDYIETGSLISIHKNTKDILIPSEEYRLKVFPLDFEEFLEATKLADFEIIKAMYRENISIDGIVCRKLMEAFRYYLAIGGMPQAVYAFVEKSDFTQIDLIKKSIIELYFDDFEKIDNDGRMGQLYLSIPSQLALGKTRFYSSFATLKKKSKKDDNAIINLIESQTVIACNRIHDPSSALALSKDFDEYKLYLSDVGLFVSMLFNDKNGTYNDIYKRLVLNKISSNLGFLFENFAAQTIASCQNSLYYYTWNKPQSTHKYELDFLLESAGKLIPLEIKSGQTKNHNSLDVFIKKYPKRIKNAYILSGADMKKEGAIDFLPIFCLSLIISG